MSKSRPLTFPACNIGITAITVKAASTHRVLLKIKDFRIGHSVKNLAQRALFFAPRAYQQFDRSSSFFSGHTLNVGETTDNFPRPLPITHPTHQNFPPADSP